MTDNEKILSYLSERFADKTDQFSIDIKKSIADQIDPITIFKTIRDRCLVDKKLIFSLGKPVVSLILQILQTKVLLPVYDKNIIGDFNQHGFDSVDSEDFPPGQGGRLPEIIYVPVPPPPVPDTLTAADRLNIEYDNMTEYEKEQKQNKYLEQFNL